MSSVKAILRIDKINAKGLAPLYLRSTNNRKSTFKALGIYIHPDDWDAVAEKVRKSKRVPNSTRINNLIAAQKLEVQNYLLDVAGGAKPYNPQAVKRAVSRFNHASFTQYAEDYLKSINTAEKYTTYKTYRTLLRNLNEYAGRELYFGDIDVTFLKDYYRYMTVTKGNTNNTALSNLKLIRKLFYDAIREEIVQPDQNPFSKFKFKWDTPDVEYLTEEEVERIETFVLSRRFSDRARPGFVCVRLLRRRNPYRRCVAFEMGQYREGTVIAYNGENQIGPEYSVTVQSASHFTTL